MIEYIIIDRSIYCNDIEIMGIPSTYDIDKIQKIYLKRCKSKSYIRIYPELKDNKTDDELLKLMNILELPKPKTFPKFAGCVEVKIKWDGDKIRTGKIIAIRWDGYKWDYRLENIGHQYDFQPEDKLFND